MELSNETPRVPELTDDLKESILSLRGHPGFQYLQKRLAFECNVLKTRLFKENDLSLTQMNNLRSGIFWTSWLDGQLVSVGNSAKRHETVRLTQSEEDLFRELNAQIELIK